MSTTTPRLLTVPQAATALALSRHTVRVWIAARRIAVVRLGRAVRVPASEVERLLNEGLWPAVRE